MAPRILLLLAALCSLPACNNPFDSSDPIFCTMDIKPAIVVRIRDSVSKLPITEGATGYVREGSYLDSLRTYAGTGQAASERRGVYTVVVMNNGYQTWKKDGVRVRRNQCHVETVTLNADLVRTTE